MRQVDTEVWKAEQRRLQNELALLIEASAERMAKEIFDEEHPLAVAHDSARAELLMIVCRGAMLTFYMNYGENHEFSGMTIEQLGAHLGRESAEMFAGESPKGTTASVSLEDVRREVGR